MPCAGPRTLGYRWELTDLRVLLTLSRSVLRDLTMPRCALMVFFSCLSDFLCRFTALRRVSSRRSTVRGDRSSRSRSVANRRNPDQQAPEPNRSACRPARGCPSPQEVATYRRHRESQTRQPPRCHHVAMPARQAGTRCKVRRTLPEFNRLVSNRANPQQQREFLGREVCRAA